MKGVGRKAFFFLDSAFLIGRKTDDGYVCGGMVWLSLGMSWLTEGSYGRGEERGARAVKGVCLKGICWVMGVKCYES